MCNRIKGRDQDIRIDEKFTESKVQLKCKKNYFLVVLVPGTSTSTSTSFLPRTACHRGTP